MPTFEAYSPEVQHVLQALRSGHPVEGDEEVTERVSNALWRFEETITANANNLPDNATGRYIGDSIGQAPSLPCLYDFYRARNLSHFRLLPVFRTPGTGW